MLKSGIYMAFEAMLAEAVAARLFARGSHLAAPT